MDAQTIESIANGALEALAFVAPFVLPEATPLIALAQKALPYAEDAIPMIAAAINEGPGAFAAAKAAAPDLAAAVDSLATGIEARLGSVLPGGARDTLTAMIVAPGAVASADRDAFMAALQPGIAGQ